MSRPPKPRWVEIDPKSTWFIPAPGPACDGPAGDGPVGDGPVVELAVEELEALRLKDLEGLDQVEAAARMNLSQSSYQRLLTRARQQVAAALVEGRALCIGGGHYVQMGYGCRCGHRWRRCGGQPAGRRRGSCCPSCGSQKVIRLEMDEHDEGGS